MPQSTSVVGVDTNTGVVQVYAPPNVAAVPTGNSNVSYGNQTSIPDGTEVPAGTGAPFILVAGTVSAVTGVIIQRVTITPA